MSKQDYPYPDDEFDALGERRVPQGVHREPTPRWRQWLPYLLVLIIVPLLTFGAVKLFAPTSSSTPEATPSETEAPPESEEPQEQEEPGEEEPVDEDDVDSEEPATDEGQESDETDDSEAEDLDYSVHVLILNGARVQGLAGQVTDALAQDGWTNAEADTYTAQTPELTTLYYTSEDFEAEANDVAQRLGIDQLVQDPNAASNGIVVVLRTDFDLPPAL